MSDEPDYAFIERIAKMAGAVGFNETRVRWKLIRWSEARQAARGRARTAAEHVSYEHAVCGNCGRILPRGTKTCPSCDSPLEPRFVQMLRRAGMHAPVPLSASTLLGLFILIAFARQMAAAPSDLMNFQTRELLLHGAHFPPLEHAGQWWRLGTAVFLHGGLIHLLFNVFALSQIGPHVEESFGPGRTLFLFVLTGIVANVPALLMDRYALGIGASGAVMGLIGIAAGWGQREGTTHGRMIRNAMLKWLLYTTLFGLFFNVDHWAHVTGFASGALLGFGLHGVPLRRGWSDAAFGIAGGLVAAALVALVVVPPKLPLS